MSVVKYLAISLVNNLWHEANIKIHFLINFRTLSEYVIFYVKMLFEVVSEQYKNNILNVKKID